MKAIKIHHTLYLVNSPAFHGLESNFNSHFVKNISHGITGKHADCFCLAIHEVHATHYRGVGLQRLEYQAQFVSGIYNKNKYLAATCM